MPDIHHSISITAAAGTVHQLVSTAEGLLAMVALLVGGCAGTTPIMNVTLPPVSKIEGTIAQIRLLISASLFMARSSDA